MTEIKLDILSNKNQKSNSDQKSITSESESGFSQDTTDPLLDTEPRLNANRLRKAQNLSNRNQLMSEGRPGSTLSACTSETTDGSECLSHPSTSVCETSSAAASVNDCDSRMQVVPDGSQFPHRRLQEVGQANTTAVQCTSPRSSYHGSSTYTGSDSPSHTHSNIVMISQRPPVNGSAVNLGHSESSANDTALPFHSSPVEATPDNGHPSYLTAPQHFLACSAYPHPDDVRRTHQRREGRANQQDFGRLIEYARTNGEPNNDVAQAQQQRLDGNENNRS